MLLYSCFHFSEVMYQMFLTVRGTVQDSFRATLGVASVSFMSTRMGNLEKSKLHPPTITNNNTSVFFFCVNLDYLDFSGGIFDF